MSEKAKEFLEAISFASSKLSEWIDEIEESEIDKEQDVEPDEQGNYKVDYIVDWIESIGEIYDRAFDLSEKWKKGDKENE